MEFRFDGGGRIRTGYKGSARDCVARSIAIATGKPYQEVYDALNALGAAERNSKRRKHKSSAREGVHTPTACRYLASLGWNWVPTMQIGSGCTTHLRAEELPAGRLIVKLSRHFTAVIDHVIHDTHDPSRDGTRCVYGYWLSPSVALVTAGATLANKPRTIYTCPTCKRESIAPICPRPACLDSIRPHYEITQHGNQYRLVCKVCGRVWSLPVGTPQVGAILRLLEHAHGHKP